MGVANPDRAGAGEPSPRPAGRPAAGEEVPPAVPALRPEVSVGPPVWSALARRPTPPGQAPHPQ